jgi:hypothetical protein
MFAAVSHVVVLEFPLVSRSRRASAPTTVLATSTDLKDRTIDFALLLFTTETAYARAAEAAGVDGFVVDWEGIGKRSRQRGADTEVSGDTPEDLSGVRGAVASPVVCRINRLGPQTSGEVEDAVARGADEVLLPMVTAPGEVEKVLELVDGRCGVGILVETERAVACAPELGRLPLSRAYVGLNDLAIERRSNSIFDAVVDGTAERVRESFEAPFGFGGLTLPDQGSPVPCRLLIGEMARLRCDFGFLRRSYRRDVAPDEQAGAVAAIRAELARAAARGPAEVRRDREELAAALGGLVPG